MAMFGSDGLSTSHAYTTYTLERAGVLYGSYRTTILGYPHEGRISESTTTVSLPLTDSTIWLLSLIGCSQITDPMSTAVLSVDDRRGMAVLRW